MDALVRYMCFVLSSTLKDFIFYCFNPITVLRVSKAGFIINTLQSGKLRLERDGARTRWLVKS